MSDRLIDESSHTTVKVMGLVGHDLSSQVIYTMYVNDAIVTMNNNCTGNGCMTVLFVTKT